MNWRGATGYYFRFLSVCLVVAIVIVEVEACANRAHANESKCPMVCVESVRKKIQTCDSKTSPALLGAGAGFMIFGPVGALVGAAMGSSGPTKCTESTEEECLRKEERCPVTTPDRKPGM